MARESMSQCVHECGTNIRVLPFKYGGVVGATTVIALHHHTHHICSHCNCPVYNWGALLAAFCPTQTGALYTLLDPGHLSGRHDLSFDCFVHPALCYLYGICSWHMGRRWFQIYIELRGQTTVNTNMIRSVKKTLLPNHYSLQRLPTPPISCLVWCSWSTVDVASSRKSVSRPSPMRHHAAACSACPWCLTTCTLFRFWWHVDGELLTVILFCVNVVLNGQSESSVQILSPNDLMARFRTPSDSTHVHTDVDSTLITSSSISTLPLDHVCVRQFCRNIKNTLTRLYGTFPWLSISLEKLLFRFKSRRRLI